MMTFEQPRVYHVSIWRYLILWWVLGPFLLLGLSLALFGDANAQVAGVVLVVIMTLSQAAWHWLTRQSRLEITARGVTVRELGAHVALEWSDIVDMRVDRGHEGFITAQRFVPIKPFAAHLRRDDLRNVITMHAPHLAPSLATLDRPQSRPALSPAIRRRNWQVAGIIAAAIAFTPVLIAAGERAQLWFFTSAAAVVSPFIALAAGYSACRQLQNRKYLIGVLILLFTAVMIGRTAVAWSQLKELAAAG